MAMTQSFRSVNSLRLATGVVCACVIASAAAAAPGARESRVPLWDAPATQKQCAATLRQARAQAAALAGMPLAQASAARVYRAWDRLAMLVEDMQGPAELLANVSPDKATRTAADACSLELVAFATELYQNEAIYARLRRTEPADEIDRKLKQDVSEAFEDTGVALPIEKRSRMKAILQRLEEIQQSFARNIRDNTTRLAFSAREVEGLPAAYLENARRDGAGNYLLGFEYPEYEPFMTNAVNEAARRRYFIAFNNRGTAANLVLLDEASRLRREIAHLYGLPSYAHFALRRRMAGKPEAVQRFLAEVRTKVSEVETREIAELRRLKAERAGLAAEAVRLERWDLAYYQEQIKKKRYDIDQEALRAYFPTAAVTEWALAVAAELYGVRFERTEAPLWHPTVRYYRVIDAKTGRFLSGIYLDLFPREGKYSHAAAFGVRGSSVLAGRTPISVLVANFNPRGLDHRELETIMHEFGHILHGVLSRTRYASQAGTSVERDFVEAPSQMFEEWARTEEPLARIQRYCSGCPAVDAALVKRLHAARSYGQGIRYARQHLYASYDMALTGEREVDPMRAWIDMEGQTPTGYVAGTEFPGAFGHLVSGYAAGYYGYMWSEVLALDMLSGFGGQPMNRDAGRRFRELILSQGSQRSAARMARAFLGREPSPEAFFAEITGQRAN